MWTAIWINESDGEWGWNILKVFGISPSVMRPDIQTLVSMKQIQPTVSWLPTVRWKCTSQDVYIYCHCENANNCFAWTQYVKFSLKSDVYTIQTLSEKFLDSRATHFSSFMYVTYRVGSKIITHIYYCSSEL
jgi:hypothetical protein